MPLFALRPSAWAAAAACALALAGASALVGCSAGQHQVIDPNEPCSSCHSEEKDTYEWGVDVPASVVESGPRVTVRADARAVSVCTPTFTSENGSSYVPVQVTTATLSGGEAVVELEDGLWALCVDEGDTARAQLVHVDSDADAAAVVEL